MRLLLNQVRYEYDIRGLITAFFPGISVESHLVTLEEPQDQKPEHPEGQLSQKLEQLEELPNQKPEQLEKQPDQKPEQLEGQPEQPEELLKKQLDCKLLLAARAYAMQIPVEDQEQASERIVADLDFLFETEGLSADSALSVGKAAIAELGEESIFAVYYGDSFTSIYAVDAFHKTVYCSASFANSAAGMEKNPLKRMTYGIFSKMTEGKTHPWGTLTGIRPIKLPMAMLEQGYSDTEIAQKLQTEYLIGDEKCKLSIQIAHKERALLDQLDYEDGYSLYIGIPFCPTTCLYCSFTSYPYSRWEKRMGEYITALEKEIDFAKEHFAGRKLNTIYFGGGTPTTLPPVYLDRLLKKITEGFDLSYLKEWTVEGGRPDSITPEKLEVLRRYPVDRISINPQTMKQETLDIIGRRHTVEDVKVAFGMARDAGFDNINMDLIIGLPQERTEDVARTMEEIEALDPDNLTVHTLAIKRASRLNMEKAQYGHLYLEQNTTEMMEQTAKSAARMGMEPYYLYRQKNMSGNLENVGYARPGKEGIYNILIMEEKQSIVALGAGAVTKRVQMDGVIERASNVKDIEQYLTRVDEMIERKRLLGI